MYLLLGLLIATSGQQTPILETLPDQSACMQAIRRYAEFVVSGQALSVNAVCKRMESEE